VFSVGFLVNIYISHLGERRYAQAVGLCGVLGSIRGQCEIYGGSNRRCDKFFFGFFYFILPVSFHQCSVLIFVFILLLSEGPEDEAWASPGKEMFVSDVGGRWTENGSRFTLSFAVSLPKVSLQFIFILPVVTVT
jgi:hypothetical protein